MNINDTKHKKFEKIIEKSGVYVQTSLTPRLSINLEC